VAPEDAVSDYAVSVIGQSNRPGSPGVAGVERVIAREGQVMRREDPGALQLDLVRLMCVRRPCAFTKEFGVRRTWSSRSGLLVSGTLVSKPRLSTLPRA